MNCEVLNKSKRKRQKHQFQKITEPGKTIEQDTSIVLSEQNLTPSHHQAPTPTTPLTPPSPLYERGRKNKSKKDRSGHNIITAVTMEVSCWFIGPSLVFTTMVHFIFSKSSTGERVLHKDPT